MRLDVDTGVVSNALPFSVVDAPVILALSPTAGPRSGGTRVTIAGARLDSAGALQCAFGGAAVPADVVSSSMVRCLSPARAGGAGVETVRLLVLVAGSGEYHTRSASAGGARRLRRMSVSSASFEFVEPPVVTLLPPTPCPQNLHPKP